MIYGADKVLFVEQSDKEKEKQITFCFGSSIWQKKQSVAHLIAILPGILPVFCILSVCALCLGFTANSC
jgi:hypothetical protein